MKKISAQLTGCMLAMVLVAALGCSEQRKSKGPCCPHEPELTINLPADYVPQEDEFLSGKRGNWMGIRLFRGRLLKERDGTHPIYVVNIQEGRFDREPIAVGDVIIGLNGKPLGPDQVYIFKTAVASALKGDGMLEVTRWRKGEIETFTLNMNITPPDLTAGGVINDVHDWQLGPTGMNGWIHSVKMDDGASRDARQIMVTYIAPESPAAGKMKRDDVIIGTDGKKFTRDARKAMAKAIEKAEMAANKGVLNLRVWREGEELDVPITLKVLPDPSPTMPYGCAKTDAMVDAACDFLKDSKLTENWIGFCNALGMLASGREDLMPKIKAFAHEICVPGEVLNVETHQSMLCWKWSYKLLFLCEYYLKTRDPHVLPTITEYATKSAMGQSGVGTWGHTVAARANSGYLHGRLGGYGAINQQGLTLMIGLPLAQKCGVNNKEIEDAIQRGNVFFSYYIDKGAIPYGDHRPNTQWFDDNGKSGSAAIMFDLIGNREGARFFSSMSLGCTPSGREAGHTGCFWSHLWGGIGAARSGQDASEAFVNEMNWSYTLERGIKGNFVFQGNAGEAGKQGESKDKAWDCTGARLLQLCLPRKHLYITGREMEIANPLGKERIAQLLAAGELYCNKPARKKLPKARIFELLADEMPAVRFTGAKAIGEQDMKIVDELVAMLDSDNRFAQYGACYALAENGYGSQKAVARLIELVETSDDLDLRLNALDALTASDAKRSLAASAKSAIPGLLRLCVKRFEIDPRRLLQRRLAFALFDRNGLISLHGIEDLDSAELVAAVRELLTVDDGRARSLVASIYPDLKDADRKALWKDIYVATRDIAPSGIMFADGVRSKGLELMAANDVAEGVDLAISFMNESRWGSGHRQKAALPVFKAYGPAARAALPHIKQLKEKKRSPEELADIEATIQAIETGEARELKSIASYIK